MKKIRIGGGAGFSGDRIEPALELVEAGRINYLVFECLAERTIALAQQRKLADPEQGYDPLLQKRMEAVLRPSVQRGVKIITNMGAANPQAAGDLVVRIGQDLGLKDLSVAVITGDDIGEQLRRRQVQLHSLDLDLDKFQKNLVSANVYLGAEPIVEALERGADVVITGRVADPSLFVAPIRHEFGWRADDWERIGHAVMLGHLMECGPHISGGYFADPGYKEVQNLDRLGYPILEAYEDGRAYITKAPGSGGLVSVRTCKEQLLYEVQDPANLISPDAVADFTKVRFEQVGPDLVQVFGAKGKPRPERLRVILCVRDGYIGEGEISYGGPGAYERACLAAHCVRKRLDLVGTELSELRVDYIGVNHLYQAAAPPLASPPLEVRLRVSGRAAWRNHAETVGYEVESLLLNGPAGGGGVRKYVQEVTPMHTAFIDRDAARCHVELRRVGASILAGRERKKELANKP